MARFKTGAQAQNQLTMLMQLSEHYQQKQDRAENKTMASLENIIKLSNLSSTSEQMLNTKKALRNISRADLTDATKIAYNVAARAIDNRSFEISKYGDSIDRGAEMINDPNFLDTAEEWRNSEGNFSLEELRKKKINKDDGTYKYNTVGEMIRDEYSAIESLYSNIIEGKKSNYRHNKNKYLDDDEVIRKIRDYKGNLEKAMSALIGDNIITIDEARMIMEAPSKEEFDAEIAVSMNQTKGLINAQNTTIVSLKNMLAKAEVGTLFDFTAEQLEGVDDDTKAFLRGDTEKLKTRIEEEEAKLLPLHQRYKYWTGRPYEALESLDSGGLGEAADDKVGETILIEAVDEVTEVTEEDLRLTEEGKKKKLLKEEKELIDTYDSDMARLEEINKSLKGPGATLTTQDRKKLGLERKRIRKKWRDEGGGIIRDAEGKIIADYRKGLKQKVLELKKRQK